MHNQQSNIVNCNSQAQKVDQDADQTYCQLNNLIKQIEQEDRVQKMDFQNLLEICQQFAKKFDKSVPKSYEQCVSFVEQSLKDLDTILEEYEELGEINEKFEKQLQRHEQEIRDHIRLQQQLKLHLESIQQKYDDQVKQNEKIISKHEETQVTFQKQKQIFEQKIQEKEGLILDLQQKLKQNTQLEIENSKEKSPKIIRKDHSKKTLYNSKKLKLQSIDNIEKIKQAFKQYSNSVKTVRSLSVERSRGINNNFNAQVLNNSINSQQIHQNSSSKNPRNSLKKKEYNQLRNSKILINKSSDISRHIKLQNQSALMNQRGSTNKTDNNTNSYFKVSFL